jgi:hypothetical protein
MAPIPWKVGNLQGTIFQQIFLPFTSDQVRLFRNSCGDMTQLTAADSATED